LFKKHRENSGNPACKWEIQMAKLFVNSDGLSEATIESNLAHLKAALNWAKRQGLLVEVPHIDMPGRAKQSKLAKGRAVMLEEFERMLAKVSDTLAEQPNRQRKNPRRLDAATVHAWRYHLRGLWGCPD
jgi:hypothetical protein